MYISLRNSLDEYETVLVLILLELNVFEVNLGMDWQREHKDQIDIYIKIITFQAL